MKRIFITESQLKQTLKLKETINMSVDKKPGQDLDSAARDAFNQAKKDAPGADINLVVNGKELNEDVEDVNIPQQVVDFIVNNYDDITCDSTISQIKDAIQDAYIECFGEEMDYSDNKFYSQVINLLMDKLYSDPVNESAIVFTKKQIKEAKKAKRIQESKVLTKGEILKSVK